MKTIFTTLLALVLSTTAAYSSPIVQSPQITFGGEWCTQNVLGYYSLETKDITICEAASSPEQISETINHERIHYAQDLKDGLDNYTLEPISGKWVVEILFYQEYDSELAQHIRENYDPSRWIIEFEAYKLARLPLGTLLTL